MTKRKKVGRPTTSTDRLVEAMTGKKKNKWKNQPVFVDGIWFQSKKEARRYGELKLLAKAGKIADLRRQVPFELVQTVVYKADFVYSENGETIVEDVKGKPTREYKAKKKLMRSQHNIEIRET